MSAFSDSSVARTQAGAKAEPRLRELDPNSLSDHLETLYRVARRLCRSHEDAEDLVQDTFARLLRRPRLLRSADERAYLIGALRNTQVMRDRTATRRPRTVPWQERLCDGKVSTTPTFDARELLAAISTAPKAYRDAVVAVDVVGLSYREAARQLRTREATITTRLHRGRRHIIQALSGPAIASSWEP
jgi:RNA polymerase sigma-70 factor (ECF subfamily)